MTRILRAIFTWLRDAYQRVAEATPGGGLGVLIIVLVLAGLSVLFIRRGRAAGHARRGQGSGLEIEPGRTAEQCRAEAAAFAKSGDWAQAVRARLRAVILTLEARGDIDPRPGRTAAEVAAEAGGVRPELRVLLWKGALTFGEIWYGRREATAEDDRTLSELDDAARRRSGSLTLAEAASVPGYTTAPR